MATKLPETDKDFLVLINALIPHKDKIKSEIMSLKGRGQIYRKFAGNA